MNRIDTGIAQLNRLRDIGIKIAIDDFGTGYASLAYLKKLPVDKIKVDRSFVKDIPDDQDDLAITKAIISMGKALDLTVIAEGIETTAQNTILMKAGCTLGQGFWFSKPRNAEQILIFFHQTKSLC
jgi:EAL domain-containing protein (putative c-di-GMP-specific phosphodiesterase class I)